MDILQIYSGYNNYFNRKLILTESTDEPVYIESINFKPNDGVSTQITVGKQGNTYYDDGDYAIVVGDDETVSHWFIIESRRECKGKYTLTLKRDLIRDFYNQWTSATSYIHKATVPEYSKFIFNQEPFTSNQIKTSEVPLKDNSNLAWIVGFVDKSMPADEGEDTRTINLTSANIIPDQTFSTYEEAANKYAKSYKVPTSFIKTTFNAWSHITNGATTYPYLKYSWTDFKNRTYTRYSSAPTDGFNIYDSTVISDLSNIINEWQSSWNQIAATYYNSDCSSTSGFASISQVERELINHKGDIIAVGSASTGYDYYTITQQPLIETTQEVQCTSSMELYGNVNGFLQTVQKESGNGVDIKYHIKAQTYTFTLEPLTVIVGKIEIPTANGRLQNKQAPFDLFCIPYGDDMSIKAYYNGNTEVTVPASKSTAMNLASEIGKGLGTYCYDIQLLPYCPMTGYSVTGNTFDIITTDKKRQTWATDEEGVPTYPIFWSTANSGTFNILHSISVTNNKMSNQLDMYRLVSPNYNGQFEFSAAMNNGVDYFNVDYTYLPYSSYIHVNPNFKGLYGSDFNDARGLICQGDFSIMYLSDAWTNYQIQNKNYNNIFDRETQTMQTQHKYQMIQQGVGSLVTAASAGVNANSVFGTAGGITAGIGSAIGGAVDLNISQKLYSEQMASRKDIFNYQLDNIKALPNSIAKTTAYTENNKIFPILEYYTCTDEEKTAFAYMIANQGMTVGVIDKAENYIGNTFTYNNITDRGFISLQLIDVTGIQGDNHIIQALDSELQIGVYTR